MNHPSITRAAACSLAAAAVLMAGCENMSERQKGTAAGAGARTLPTAEHAVENVLERAAAGTVWSAIAPTQPPCSSRSRSERSRSLGR